MSTRFLRATHKTTRVVTEGFDSEAPLELITALRESDGASFDFANYTVDLLNYRMDVVEANYDLLDQVVSVRIRDLL